MRIYAKLYGAISLSLENKPNSGTLSYNFFIFDFQLIFFWPVFLELLLFGCWNFWTNQVIFLIFFVFCFSSLSFFCIFRKTPPTFLPMFYWVFFQWYYLFLLMVSFISKSSATITTVDFRTFSHSRNKLYPLAVTLQGNATLFLQVDGHLINCGMLGFWLF